MKGLLFAVILVLLGLAALFLSTWVAPPPWVRLWLRVLEAQLALAWSALRFTYVALTADRKNLTLAMVYQHALNATRAVVDIISK